MDGINHCYLKHKAGNRESKQNYVSGHKSCKCGGHKKCQEDGVDYRGTPWSIFPQTFIMVPSENECACECDKDEKCGSWTFVKGLKIIYTQIYMLIFRNIVEI